jgi:hypothetical protein
MSRSPKLHLFSVHDRGRGCLLAGAAVLIWLALFPAARAESPAGRGAEPTSDAAALPDAPQPQSGDPSEANPGDRKQVTLRGTPVRILKDEAGILTSPARLHGSDYAVLVGLALATTVTVTADHQIMSSSKLNDTSLNNHAVTASNGLMGAFVAAPAVIYGLGYIHHDDDATETGILGGEAMVDGLVIEEAMKLVSMRERPTVDGAKGKFFQTGVGFGSSFPSTHSVIAWSSAAVIASEYRPGHRGERGARGGPTALPFRRAGRLRGGLACGAVCLPQTQQVLG